MPSAPTVVSATAHAGNPTTSATITLPATQAGDLILVAYTLRNATDGATLGGTWDGTGFLGLPWWATPALSTSPAPYSVVVWSRASKNHAGQTITIANASANSISAMALVVRGGWHVDDSLINDGHNVQRNTASTAANLPGFTVGRDDSLILFGYMARDDQASWTSITQGASGMSSLGIANSTGGTDSSVGVAELDQASAGSSGDFASTLGSSTIHVVWALALMPAYVYGSAAQALPAIESASEATATASATAASTLPAISTDAEAEVAVSGTSSPDLPSLASAAEGTATAEATAASALPALEQASQGELTVQGTAQSSLPSLGSVASAAATVDGDAAQTIPSLSGAAEGTVGDPAVSGEASSALPSLSSTASGQARVDAVVASVLAAMTSDSDGALTVGGDGTSILPAIVSGAPLRFEAIEFGQGLSATDPGQGEVLVVGSRGDAEGTGAIATEKGIG